MKPCELVTKEQTAAYSLNHAVPSRGGDHFQDCLWEGLASSQFKLMWLRFYYDTNWLARIYRNEAEPYYHDWVPLTIAGRPAARQGEPIRNEQPTKTEGCRVAVALSDSQAVDVSIVSADSSCDRAAMVAEAIVHNLGG